ncbi:concanavalin A-like lectin/glucanase [Trichocladium antarcticum]|uniref:Concanavalin A-like lectin/glucanase n=1 Tax=Trichocladium antarcticum TaxID=1450529 RepID=A0AAN6ZFR4_9PEZI|nr:concanavalin A-like lectin/glucanase [Trichocladium antarcticum]
MRPTTLLTTLLLTTATATSASTLPHRPRPRAAHDLRLLHTFTPAPPANTRLLLSSSSASSPQEEEEEESTKGGAILTLPTNKTNKTNQTITSIHSTFRLPAAAPPSRGPTAHNPSIVHAASFWLGLDSIAPATEPSPCSGSALRAGIDIFHDGRLGGAQTPFAWYQLAPGMVAARGFAGGFAVAAGDLVRFTLRSEGSGGGGDVVVVVVEVDNFGSGVNCTAGRTPVQSVREVLRVGAGQGLCGRQAAWVVEDFPLAGMPDFPVSLANFTRVDFGQAGVGLGDGTRRDLSGAEVVDVRLAQQGGRLTKCDVVGGSIVRCTRVVGDE